MQGPAADAKPAAITLAKPSKPLKILTLDGGGLQAIAALLILDQLLDSIHTKNGGRKPRPCDVFDTIAGIGTGGWLAILLGRFHLDITACLTEWFNLTQSIMSQSRGRSYRRRLFQKSYFDNSCLKEEIDRLTKVYGTGSYLHDTGSKLGSVRCKHVFVAALQADCKHYNVDPNAPKVRGNVDFGRDYCLFRSYRCPDGAEVRRGPRIPDQFKIASAFGVTGAAKYFFAPWKEEIAGNGSILFGDNIFPHPHNITELALDEMWGLYGRDVQIDVVVNIGPGLPSQNDVASLTKRFSWGLNSRGSSTKSYKSQSSSGAWSSASARSPPTPAFRPGQKATANNPLGNTGLHGEGRTDPNIPDRKFAPPSRTTTFFSVKGVTLNEKLKRSEDQIEAAVCSKLANAYPKQQRRWYFRLAPDQSAPGTQLNDSLHSSKVMDHTLDHLRQGNTSANLEQAAEQVAQ